MFSLLRSFTAVLDEFGVSYGRAKKAALCAGEGLLIVSNVNVQVAKRYLSYSQAGPVLKTHSSASVDEIINAIQAYTETTSQQKWLVSPSTRISSQAIPSENTVEVRQLIRFFGTLTKITFRFLTFFLAL